MQSDLHARATAVLDAVVHPDGARGFQVLESVILLQQSDDGIHHLRASELLT